MTPMKCWRHEQWPSELGDSPRYLRALAESRRCWRCRLIAEVAGAAHRVGLEHSRLLGKMLRPLIERSWLKLRVCPIENCGHPFDAHLGRCTVADCRCLLRVEDLEPLEHQPKGPPS